jgi:hypothetical protein
MNQFTALGTAAVNAELEYRRIMLSVSSHRRSRRQRRAVR